MIAEEIIEIINRLAPPKLAEKWDNSGLQLGSFKKQVRNILLALDITPDVVKEAIKNKVDMIITHHPLIFNPIKNINIDTVKGEMIYNLIKNDIIVFSAHTNLDASIGGVNDVLATLIGLRNTKTLNKTNKEVVYDIYPLANKGIEYGIGRIGELEKPMTLGAFAETVKQKLKCDNIRIYGEMNKLIKFVALCGGSGADYIEDAYQEKADVFVTGDIRYHEAQKSLELGLPIIDANHYNTERVVLPEIKKYIESIIGIGTLKILISNIDCNAHFITL